MDEKAILYTGLCDCSDTIDQILWCFVDVHAVNFMSRHSLFWMQCLTDSQCTGWRWESETCIIYFNTCNRFGFIGVNQGLVTHTHPFNGPFSGTTQVSRYQKGKTNLDFTGARDSEW